MSDNLSAVQERVAQAMGDIVSNFKAGVKITVLVRTPGEPDCDFLMTNDEPDEAIALIGRRFAEPSA